MAIDPKAVYAGVNKLKDSGVPVTKAFDQYASRRKMSKATVAGIYYKHARSMVPDIKNATDPTLLDGPANAIRQAQPLRMAQQVAKTRGKTVTVLLREAINALQTALVYADQQEIRLAELDKVLSLIKK